MQEWRLLRFNRSFPKNEWSIRLNCVQEPVCVGGQMQMVLRMSLLSFPPGRRPYWPEAEASQTSLALLRKMTYCFAILEYWSRYNLRSEIADCRLRLNVFLVSKF